MSNDQSIGAGLHACWSRYWQKESALSRCVVLILQTHVVARENDKLGESLASLEAALQKTGLSVSKYFAGTFLFSKTTQIEQYFVDVVRVVSSNYPKKLGKMEFKFAEILDSTKEELTLRAAEDFINKLTYKKPFEYLDSLADFLSINPKAVNTHWKSFVRLKACRDIGIHNEWLVNETYLRKLFEAGMQSDLKIGENACPELSSLMTSFNEAGTLINALSTELRRVYVPQPA